MVCDHATQAGPFIALISSGAALEEALSASAMLRSAGIPHRVINVLNLSRISAARFRQAVAGASTIISTIDARPEKLVSSLLYQALSPEDCGKVIPLGIRGWGERTDYGARTQAYRRHGFDANSLYARAVEAGPWRRNGAANFSQQTSPHS